MLSKPGRYGRRGSVLILVIGVLAMLFVIGSTQLMVARFEKQNAEKKASSSNLKSVMAMLYGPIAEMFQNDALAAVNADLDPALQDSADFAGSASEEAIVDYVNDYLAPYWAYLQSNGYDVGALKTELYRKLRLGRSGDGLLASIEPHFAPEFNAWRFWAVSLGVDALTDPTALPLNNTFQPVMSMGQPAVANNGSGDSDGEGYTDAARLDVALSSMFSGKYSMYQRIIAHGGMVMLDRMTHPALIAQVIHPKDDAHANPKLLLEGPWTRTSTDEARLRRRFMLPDSTAPDSEAWSMLPTNDLRKLLPFTLGYDASRYRDRTPHWFPVGSDLKMDNDDQWWESRMRPGYGLNEAGYSVNNDDYDRRHLLTVHSYDDLLRPQRNESRLLRLPVKNEPNTFMDNPVFARFFHVINPTAASELVQSDYGTYETQGRFPGTSGSYGPPLAYGMMQTGPDSFSLEFNRPGLRTPFSLRDTLVLPTSNQAFDTESGNLLNWGYQASFRRAAQLVGYYLAMIQNTTVPGAARAYDRYEEAEDLRVQFKTALQLAVNTLDFADNADVNGDGYITIDDVVSDTNGDGTLDSGDIPVDPVTALTFSWVDQADKTQTYTAYGFEKQPFITEAYVKLMHKPVIVGESYAWTAEPDPYESIYAVELYNPYPEAMRLDDFALKLSPTIYADLAGITIPAGSYIVLANTSVDTARKLAIGESAPFADPFIQGAEVGTNLLIANEHFKVLSLTEGTPATETSPGVPDETSETGVTDFKIQNFGVSLVRKTVLHLGVDEAGMPIARLEGPTSTNRVGARVVVDTLLPSGIGSTQTTGTIADNHAQDDRFAADVSTTEIDDESEDDESETETSTSARPVMEFNGDAMNDRLVSESSLQRRKNHNNWHFTVGRQMVFPLPWFEHPDNLNTALSPPAPFVSTRPDSPPQHNLLGTNPWTDCPYGSNQALVARYMDGVETYLTLTAPPTKDYLDERTPFLIDLTSVWTMPLVDYAETPAAPVHLVTSDLGLDAFGRCRAYPTTGTLLLIPRYAHVRQTDGIPDMPVTMAVALAPRIIDPRFLTFDRNLERLPNQQLIQMDNGHMPVFDYDQVVVGEPRRLGMPWGQLVFDYFTALPIEELFQYKDLRAIGGPASARLVDLYDERNTVAFENAYKFVVNGLNPTAGGNPIGTAYGSAPVQDLVATDGVRTLGPRVRGRINVNVAPWWVLDGLPVLPDQYVDPTNPSNPYPGLFNNLPVPQLLSAELDPKTADYNHYPASIWLNTILMDPVSPENADFATLSSMFARYLVSYREKRLVDGQGPELYYVAGDPARNPGLVGVGAMADVGWRIPMSAIISYNDRPIPANTPVGLLRQVVDPNNATTSGIKPYAYLGYLQLVAPMVRLQDWVTVRSHVYTLYNVVGDTTEPPVWLRSQTTIDRTRCLYTNDLPERIVQTEPISYFNAVSDQQ